MFNTLIIQPIFNLLLFLYSIIPGGDFGLAIIIFTVIVRFALYPLVKKQLKQTKLMQKMQPELVRIKKESKGNKQLESMQMLELYKKHGVSPFKSILILFIQLPIFIALYQVIQIFLLNSTQISEQVSKLAYGFIQNLKPVQEFIHNPDLFNKELFGFIDLTKSSLNPFNIFLFILVILAGVTQYVLSRQTTITQKSNRKLKDIMKEAAEGKTADQSEMNAIMMSKMTKFLPIMMMFIMSGLPGALVLYYLVSNGVAVLQQRYILKQDTEEMIEIADEAPETQVSHKKATAKARSKVAQEATITRIVAKDNSKKSK